MNLPAFFLKTNLSTQLISSFTRSAGAILFGLALAMIVANLSLPALTRPRDPILGVPVSSLFWVIAGLELTMGWTCLFKKGAWLQTLAVLWLSAASVVYWLGLRFDGGVADLNLYLTSVGDAFAVGPGFAYAALRVSVLYLLVGSGACLVWLCRERGEGRNHIRGACNHCGGHIEFPAANVGQAVPCPHCQRTMLLRKPHNLKTACFFCHGHIEFPSHALGEKLKCPHCKMDITLKEPHEQFIP